MGRYTGFLGLAVILAAAWLFSSHKKAIKLSILGWGISLQFAFATYMAQVADVEVSKDGAVRVRRVVCAVDCGIPVNPDTIRAQIQIQR